MQETFFSWVWLILLSMAISSYLFTLKCHRFVLLNIWVTLHGIQIPHFLYLCLCWWTTCLSACLGSCDQYCSKHGCGSSSVQGWHGFLRVWIQVEYKVVPLFKFLKIIFLSVWTCSSVCGCVWGWTHGCRCLWRSEGSDPRETEQQAVVSNWRRNSIPPNRVT